MDPLHSYRLKIAVRQEQEELITGLTPTCTYLSTCFSHLKANSQQNPPVHYVILCRPVQLFSFSKGISKKWITTSLFPINTLSSKLATRPVLMVFLCEGSTRDSCRNTNTRVVTKTWRIILFRNRRSTDIALMLFQRLESAR